MEEKIYEVHDMKLVKGIFKPKTAFSGLGSAEEMRGISWRLFTLSFINAGLSALMAYFTYQMYGYPDFVLQLIETFVSANESVLTVYLISAGILGLAAALLVPAAAAFIFWPFFRYAGFKKLFVIHVYTLLIAVIAMAIQLALFLVFEFRPTAYLSVGSYTRLLTDDIFINTLFGGVTLFFIWKLFVLVTAVNHSTIQSKSYVAVVVIFLNVLFLLLAGFAAEFVQSDFFLWLMEGLIAKL